MLLVVYSVFREVGELCVFGEYAESNVAFSPKTQSETVRFYLLLNDAKKM